MRAPHPPAPFYLAVFSRANECLLTTIVSVGIRYDYMDIVILRSFSRMKTEISKSEFKARALEILRSVEDTGQSVLITDRGVPTVELRRYRGKLRDAREILKGSVVAFLDPTEPTGENWQALE